MKAAGREVIASELQKSEAIPNHFAGFAQVSKGAILFGAIGPSIMSLIDGLLTLVIDGSRDVLGPQIIRPAACAAIAIIIPIDMETPGSLNMNGIPSPRENDGT